METYELDVTTGPDSNGLRLVTRLVPGAMLYLSNAVSVPKVHNRLLDPNADLNSPLKKVREVRVSASPVDDACVAVQHRGYWFYVDNEDTESKRTLGLWTSLIRLSISAGGAQNVPILTLPVSR